MVRKTEMALIACLGLAANALGVTITLDPKNGDPVGTITAEAGTAISAPEAPTKKPGFTFLGWFAKKAKTPFVFDVMPDENVALTGKWEWTRGARPDLYSEDKLLEIDMPLLVINTDDGEEPDYEVAYPPPGCGGQSIKNASKVPGRLVMKLRSETLYDSGEYVKKESGLTVKIRGNTSVGGRQKPYKLKLQKKADLLMLDDGVKRKNKDWVLLATTQNLKNDFGFLINGFVGMQWTPRYRYVNVMINGDYRGLYLLCESEAVDEDCRIDVNADTGFLIEHDPYWWNEDAYFKTKTSLSTFGYTFKYPDPEDLTEEQLLAASNAISRVEDSLLDGTYPKLIDVPSFAGWLLAHDLLGTYDAGGSNKYMTKFDDRDESKVMMANLWDFDTTMWTSNEWAKIHTSASFVFPKLIASTNPAFRDEYRLQWLALRARILPLVDAALAEIGDGAETLNAARKINRLRWGSGKDVETEFDGIRNWYATRVEWIDEHISEMTSENQYLVVDPNGGSYLGSVTPTVMESLLMAGTPLHGPIGRAYCGGLELIGFFDAPEGGVMGYDATGRAVKGTYRTESSANGGVFCGTGDLVVYAQWRQTNMQLTVDP
ncbi:MAG: CotH kinase family protein, partial [bacterium]|nr:CotH kinase family protein [Candidatus Colisoma equi]